MIARLARLNRDRRAAASLEFVVVAPVLLSLAIGMAETVRYIRARSQLFQAATAMADMVAGLRTVTPGAAGLLTDLCRGAQLGMAPLRTASLGMTVASFTYPNGAASRSKDWENTVPCPTTGATTAAAVSSGAATLTPTRGDSIVAVSAFYTYTPMVSAVLPTVTFTQVAYARPRFGTVLCPTC